MLGSETRSTSPAEFCESRVAAFLYRGTHVAVLKNALLGLLLAGQHWSLFRSVDALIWYALLLAVLVMRSVIFARYRRKEVTDAESRVWLIRFRLGIAATAAVWGAASPLLLSQTDSGVEILLAFVLSGLTAGATASLAPDRFSYLSFLLMALVPLVLALFFKADEYHLYVTLMVVLFAVFMAFNAERIRRSWLENILVCQQQAAVEQALLQQKKMAEIIARAQSSFIHEDDRRVAFNKLLTDILALTQSEYGFIGEILRDAKGELYLKSHAITNIAWNQATEAFYQENAPKGMEFTNLKILFGEVMTSGKTVIANQPASDPRRGGLPPGHPALNAFFGVPVFHGGVMKGMIGLANRPGGYDESLELFLQPLLTTIGQLIDAVYNLRAKAAAEQALAKQAQHMQAIIDNMLDGLITIDTRGFIRVFNPAAERIFGYSAAEMLGANVSLLMPTEHSVRHDNYLKQYQATRIAQIIGRGREVQGLRRDGSLFPMSLSITEINNNGEVEYLGMVADITERKRLDQLKNEFVSIVSHELRTPLTSIAGVLGLVVNGSLGTFSDNAEKMLRIAHKNSLRLGLLINDLLDMEKLVVGQMHFEMAPYFIQPLLAQAIKDNQVFADSYGVIYQLVETSPNLQVRVDALRLQQILANFLSNAAKFSPEGSQVEIGAQAISGAVKVYVKDQGSGIPEKFKERIFSKFAQADSSDTRQKGGTGLGLAICKELIERMGGAIGFEPVVPQGTCFYITLPLVVSSQEGTGEYSI